MGEMKNLNYFIYRKFLIWCIEMSSIKKMVIKDFLS